MNAQPIADERSVPFFWITTTESTLIRREVGNGDGDPGLSQVVAVHTALVEIANEARARTEVGDDSLGFTAERKKLVVYSGASESTVKRAIGVLERIGLVRVERRPIAGDRNLPNRYVLTGGAGHGERDGGQGKPHGGVQGGPEKPQESQGLQEPPVSPPVGGGSTRVDANGDFVQSLGGDIAIVRSPAAQVHHCYVQTFDKVGRAANFRADERKIIDAALEAGSVEELEACIRACAASDYHMKRGEYANRKGGKYNSLGKILKPRPRNGETQRSRIEWWLDRATETAPRRIDVTAEADRIAKAQGLA